MMTRNTGRAQLTKWGMASRLPTAAKVDELLAGFTATASTANLREVMAELELARGTEERLVTEARAREALLRTARTLVEKGKTYVRHVR